MVAGTAMVGFGRIGLKFKIGEDDPDEKE